MCLCRPGQELITLLGQCNRLLVLMLRRVPQVAGDKGGLETGYLFLYHQPPSEQHWGRGNQSRSHLCRQRLAVPCAALALATCYTDPGRLVLCLQLWACYVQLLFHSSSWEVVESLLEVSLHASMARGWLSCNGDDIFWEMMIKDWILRYITVPIFRQTHIIHTYIHIYIYNIYIYIYLSISLSIYRSIDLSINLSIYRSIDLSIYRSIYPSIHPSIHLSIHSSIDLSIYRSNCNMGHGQNMVHQYGSCTHIQGWSWIHVHRDDHRTMNHPTWDEVPKCQWLQGPTDSARYAIHHIYRNVHEWWLPSGYD